MTRESKLALILSFVLILVVGVLVSDHFSQAGSMDIDRLAAQERQPLSQLPGAERHRIEDAIDRVMPAQTAATTPVDPGPVVISNGSLSSSGSLLGELSNGLNRTIEDLREAELASKTTNPRVVETVPVSRPLGQIEHKTYTVGEGDSLYQIAKQTLGDGNRWGEIQRLNADLVGPRGIINPGMTLKLPTNARVTPPKQVLRSTIAQPDTRSVRSYTVAPGDTLGEISIEFLGTSKRMGEIVRLNGLDDADDIRVGMTLKIPSK